jgi:hypothetical protein
MIGTLFVIGGVVLFIYLILREVPQRADPLNPLRTVHEQTIAAMRKMCKQ